jgi:hypothetical protein
MIDEIVYHLTDKKNVEAFIATTRFSFNEILKYCNGASSAWLKARRMVYCILTRSIHKLAHVNIFHRSGEISSKNAHFAIFPVSPMKLTYS